MLPLQRISFFLGKVCSTLNDKLGASNFWSLRVRCVFAGQPPCTSLEQRSVRVPASVRVPRGALHVPARRPETAARGARARARQRARQRAAHTARPARLPPRHHVQLHARRAAASRALEVHAIPRRAKGGLRVPRVLLARPPLAIRTAPQTGESHLESRALIRVISFSFTKSYVLYE